MTQRCLAFTNVFNFRDLGGYPATGGATVAWRRLFRSDDLSRLEPADYDTFFGLGIRTVIDLRRPAEVAQDGRVMVRDGVSYCHLPLEHRQWLPAQFPDTAAREAYLRERYLDLAHEAADGLAQVLALIADPQRAPLVVHCVAGKDRTGIVAALTLALLGVADATIADDYYLSEAAEPAAWEYYRSRRDDLPAQRWHQFTVSPRASMLRFLRDLRSRYGSVTGYATAIGVTSAQIVSMRAHLLVPGEPVGAQTDPPVLVGDIQGNSPQ